MICALIPFALCRVISLTGVPSWVFPNSACSRRLSSSALVKAGRTRASDKTIANRVRGKCIVVDGISVLEGSNFGIFPRGAVGALQQVVRLGVVNDLLLVTIPIDTPTGAPGNHPEER